MWVCRGMLCTDTDRYRKPISETRENALNIVYLIGILYDRGGHMQQQQHGSSETRQLTLILYYTLWYCVLIHIAGYHFTVYAAYIIWVYDTSDALSTKSAIKWVGIN